MLGILLPEVTIGLISSVSVTKTPLFSLPFICSKPLDQIAGKRVLCFSYGSGMAASMFVINISSDCAANSALAAFYNGISDVPSLLKARQKIAPKDFVDTHHLYPYVPTGPVDNLTPGTYYLESIDELFRRKYGRKGSHASP